jgi:hypothetical protein
MDYLPIFVVVTSAAVVLQAGILAAMYLALRKTTSQLEILATEVRTKILPTAEIARSMIADMRPTVETVVENVGQSSTLIRTQLEHIDETVGELVDRTRLQFIRADDLLGRTFDRIEETRDIVAKTVVSPARQVSGLVRGLSVAFETFFGGRRYPQGRASVPSDDLFI